MSLVTTLMKKYEMLSIRWNYIQVNNLLNGNQVISGAHIMFWNLASLSRFEYTTIITRKIFVTFHPNVCTSMFDQGRFIYFMVIINLTFISFTINICCALSFVIDKTLAQLCSLGLYDFSFIYVCVCIAKVENCEVE